MDLHFMLLFTLMVSLSCATKKECGGLKGLSCPKGYKCVDNPRDQCDPQNGDKDCIGYCIRKKPQPCGSRGLSPCPDTQICVDPDPYDGCDPAADCPGICVTPGRRCGFHITPGCRNNQRCVDDPRDNCTPPRVQDCPGVCIPR